MSTRNNWRSHPRLRRIATTAFAMIVVAIPAAAAVQTYFMTGQVRSGTFAPIPAGTSFIGNYSFDDAASDTNGAADTGTYATGSFHVDFGPTIGWITFDGTPTTTVRNNQPGLFSSQADIFSIGAMPGARNTPAFSNDIEPVPNLLFRQTMYGTAATALTSDALNAVPQVFGSPWDPNDQLVTIGVDAAAGGCPPFASNCYVNMVIESLAQAFTLTVTTDGEGTGVVTSDPAGIDCGGTCSALLGGTVSLTAVPDPESLFVAWTGCDSVSENHCTVTLGADTTVNATFEPIPPPVPAVTPAGLVVATLLLAVAGALVMRRV